MIKIFKEKDIIFKEGFYKILVFVDNSVYDSSGIWHNNYYKLLYIKIDKPVNFENLFNYIKQYIKRFYEGRIFICDITKLD